MTNDRLDLRLKNIEDELEIIKKDILAIRERIGEPIVVEEKQVKLNLNDIRHMRGLSWKVFKTISTTIIIILFSICLAKGFYMINRLIYKIDNVGVPVGYERGGVIYTFPPDTKVILWPDDFGGNGSKDTIKNGR